MRPNTQQQFRKTIRWVLGVLLIILIVYPASSVGQYAYNADKTPAKEWMKLKHDHRAFFILGFLAGIEHAHSEGGKVITFSKNQSTKEVTQRVYEELLSSPELRQGPIGLIIANVLRYQVTEAGQLSLPTSQMLSDIND